MIRAIMALLIFAFGLSLGIILGFELIYRSEPKLRPLPVKTGAT